MVHLRLAGHFPTRQPAVKTCLRPNGKQFRPMPQYERGNICKGIAAPQMHSWAGLQNRLSAMPRKRQFEGSFHEQFLTYFQWLNPLNRGTESANSMS
ncbi:hypothetical protein CUJ84_Chr001381 [Rhizobium leguminosarum]|uniref:Uncharacterized protein n=1 Tax=Rhizobium leguminosarum TaxID=384 RepID=A0A2K9Z0L0_RHILE|nr:hypothetical protein CUJ84_Chr001381 [Rhizobium leguminosarum]